ncbi:Rad2 nuclease [Sorochytrium milnesiophthora]
MGISGLLPLLRSVQKTVHVGSLKGQQVGVDAYVWLHRGAFSCAMELCTAKPTLKYLNYCVHQVQMLLHYGVRPYIVFDGGYLPMKAGTEESRRLNREKRRAEGLALLRAGQKAEAAKCFQKCVDVTPEMAYQLIKALRRLNVPYVVAPYEADAQLAYLERQGIISAIITEDSDMLVFGCKRIIYKLDKYGEGVQIDRADLPSTTEVSLIGWTDDLFRQMCILSGCDYLPSIVGLGLRKAHSYLTKHKSVARLLQAVRMDGYVVPADYEEQFRRAEATFLHQRVFCPQQKKLVHLTPPPSDTLDAVVDDYVGPMLEDDVAVQVAKGTLDPITFKCLVLQPVVSNETLAVGLRRAWSTPTQQTSQSRRIEDFLDKRFVKTTKSPPPSPETQTSLKRSISADAQLPSATDSHALGSPPKKLCTPATRVVSQYFSVSRTTAVVRSATVEEQDAPLLPTPLSFSLSEPLQQQMSQISHQSFSADDDTPLLPSYSQDSLPDLSVPDLSLQDAPASETAVAEEDKENAAPPPRSVSTTPAATPQRRGLSDLSAQTPLQQSSKHSRLMSPPTSSSPSPCTSSPYFQTPVKKTPTYKTPPSSVAGGSKTLGMGSARSLKRSQPKQQITIAAHLERHWNKPVSGW